VSLGGNNAKAMPTITAFDPRELRGELPEGQKGLYDIDMEKWIKIKEDYNNKRWESPVAFGD